MKLFTVHDKASETFYPLQTIETERDAIESFRQAVNDPKTIFNKFPADFTLIQVGTFDLRTGQGELIQHKIISNATALLDKKNDN